jgi:hypothetical protein
MGDGTRQRYGIVVQFFSHSVRSAPAETFTFSPFVRVMILILQGTILRSRVSRSLVDDCVLSMYHTVHTRNHGSDNRAFCRYRKP